MRSGGPGSRPREEERARERERKREGDREIERERERKSKRFGPEQRTPLPAKGRYGRIIRERT